MGLAFVRAPTVAPEQLKPNSAGQETAVISMRLLGFELWPSGRRRLPDDNVSRAVQRRADCRAGFASGSLDEQQVRQRIAGWVAHARQADTWQLRAQWFPAGWFNPAGEPPRPRTRASAPRPAEAGLGT